jgi:hypothetical protein
MRTPLHFSSPTEFRLYVLRCALRDRTTFRASIAQAKGDEINRRETDREIACIESEIKRIERKNDR